MSPHELPNADSGSGSTPPGAASAHESRLRRIGLVALKVVSESLCWSAWSVKFKLLSTKIAPPRPLPPFCHTPPPTKARPRRYWRQSFRILLPRFPMSGSAESCDLGLEGPPPATPPPCREVAAFSGSASQSDSRHLRLRHHRQLCQSALHGMIRNKIEKVPLLCRLCCRHNLQAASLSVNLLELLVGVSKTTPLPFSA